MKVSTKPEQDHKAAGRSFTHGLRIYGSKRLSKCELQLVNTVSFTIVLLTVMAGCGGGAEYSSEPGSEAQMTNTFNHPSLGELYPEDVDWCTDAVAAPFSTTPIQVCLAEGSETGPSDIALAGYGWLETHWMDVQKLMESQAYSFYEPYAESVSSIPRFGSADELWGTETVLNVSVFAADNFTVTLRFEWQEEDDPHEITFYIEGGKCETHSVDG